MDQVLRKRETWWPEFRILFSREKGAFDRDTLFSYFTNQSVGPVCFQFSWLFFVEKKITLIEFPNSNKVVLKFLARLKSHSVLSCFSKNLVKFLLEPLLYFWQQSRYNTRFEWFVQHQIICQQIKKITY